MIITKKAIPRRTFLRGMGATLALPLAGLMADRPLNWYESAPSLKRE